MLDMRFGGLGSGGLSHQRTHTHRFIPSLRTCTPNLCHAFNLRKRVEAMSSRKCTVSPTDGLQSAIRALLLTLIFCMRRLAPNSKAQSRVSIVNRTAWGPYNHPTATKMRRNRCETRRYITYMYSIRIYTTSNRLFSFCYEPTDVWAGPDNLFHFRNVIAMRAIYAISVLG